MPSKFEHSFRIVRLDAEDECRSLATCGCGNRVHSGEPLCL